MKKKIFSALLMGVFTLASMSMFVSCKDYDDDINGLDTQQQELLSRLEALEGNVDTNLSTLKDQLATATENANKALTGVQGLEGTVNEVSSTAQAAGNAATAAQGAADDAQEAADAAQKTADEALATAKAALEAAGADGDGATALEQVAALANRVGALEGMVDVLKPLMEQVEKAMTEDLPALKKKVDMYEAYFDNLFAMVTSVELYGTFSGNGTVFAHSHSYALDENGNVVKDGNGNPVIDEAAPSYIGMTLLHGNVIENSVFGDNEAYTTASPQKNFVKGADIKGNQGILVRVNPVNAKIDGKNCSIKLINSLGEDLSDYVAVTGVKEYDQLITRAGKINSGLYMINYEFVDGVDISAFRTATKSKGKDVLFAVAINNTDTMKAERYVASTFDLALNDKTYESTTDLNFSVTGTNGTQVAKATKDNSNLLKNRWANGNVAVDDNGDAIKDGPTEYTWKANDPLSGVFTPATAPIKDYITEDENDYRAGAEFLPVEVGTPFTVQLIENGTVDYSQVAYYYVVLDKDFAGESAPSEWNAWSTYSYTRLGQVVSADKKLDITINSASANGDRIGFRLFAVNYDGTLVDPDGKAFYVAVGNSTTTTSVNVPVKAWLTSDQASVIVALPSDFKPVTCGENGTVSYGTVGQKEFDANGSKSSKDAQISWWLLDKNKKSQAAAGTPTAIDWKDAKYIEIKLNNVQNFLDDATFSFVIKGESKDGNVTRVVNTINVNVTKIMPTKDNTDFSFKAGQLVNGVYTCYLDAGSYNAPVWTKASDNGYKNLWNFVTGVDESKDFIFTFANAVKDNNGKYTKPLSVTAYKDADGKVVTKTYVLTVPNDLIDSKTEHATTITRNYPNISYRYNVLTGENAPAADYNVNLLTCNTIFACPVEPSVLTYSWLQQEVKDEDGKVTGHKDVNYIYYDAKNAANFGDDNTKLASFIKATSAVDPTLYTLNKQWNAGMYQSIVSCELISDDTQKSDYFTVDCTGDTFTFTTVSGATNPVADVPSHLVIKVKDAFGHSYTALNLPFTVKKR